MNGKHYQCPYCEHAPFTVRNDLAEHQLRHEREGN